MECNFCKSVFTTKSHLNAHQKKAKYCLEIQMKQTYICEFCDTLFDNNELYTLWQVLTTTCVSETCQV